MAAKANKIGVKLVCCVWLKEGLCASVSIEAVAIQNKDMQATAFERSWNRTKAMRAKITQSLCDENAENGRCFSSKNPPEGVDLVSLSRTGSSGHATKAMTKAPPKNRGTIGYADRLMWLHNEAQITPMKRR